MLYLPLEGKCRGDFVLVQLLIFDYSAPGAVGHLELMQKNW